MKNKVMKKTLAFLLALCLTIPAVSFQKDNTIDAMAETTNAETTVGGVGDVNGDNKIDACELVRIKKSEQSANKRAALHFSNYTETLTHFVTKNAYAGGSTVTFDVYVPAGVHANAWWGVAAVKDPATGDYYACATSGVMEQVTARDTWTTVTYTLPTGSSKYYIGFGGDTGKNSNWVGHALYIDNFKVVYRGNTVAEENFEQSFADGIFSVVKKGVDYHGDGYIAVSREQDPQTVSYKDEADLNNDGVNDEKDATLMRKYLVDKIYSFYRPDTSVVKNDTATYQVTDELDRTMTDQAPKNGKDVGVRYYLHLGSGKVNQMAAIQIANLNEKPLNFVTKEAYPEGSTVTFEAYVPEGAGWWGAAAVADPNAVDVYACAAAGADLSGQTIYGGWKEYSIQLPTGQSSYVVIGGAVGSGSAWKGKELLVDNFRVTDTSGTVIAEEDFEGGFADSIFNVNTVGTDYSTGGTITAITLEVTLEEEEELQLYSVENILATNEKAYESAASWLAAGGGKVGENHWWGKSLFGYYTSLDEWVIERDVQMLTDAGVDFLAIDVTKGIVYESQLTLLLQTLNKFYEQGFNVPKVTFTSDVSGKLEAFYNNEAYAHLWYQKNESNVVSTENLDMETVRAASSMGEAMSASAFYGNKMNHKRTYNGKKHLTGEKAVLKGPNFAYEFKNAIASATDTILIESWNEWISKRTKVTNSDEPIVLYNNADMANSSDFQPMSGGYGDYYYMQMLNCIKQYKGNSVTNRNLNTAEQTENIAIDIEGDFKQWNQISTHYLDYTGEISDRDAKGYEDIEIIKNNMVSFEACQSDSSSLVTKKTYAGGSTVSFKAYIPADLAERSSGGAPWWVLCATTSATNTDIYSNWVKSWAPGSSELGQWKYYEVTLPTDSSSYYIYFAGEAGQWKNNNGENVKILIDEFKVTSNGITESDSFDNGLTGGLFNSSGSAFALHTASSVKSNQVAAISMWTPFAEDGTSFMTQNAYPGGSVVTFEAYLPASSGWWGVGYSTTTTGDVYGIAGLNDKMGIPLTGETLNGAWKEYSVTLPEGGPYYIYIGGAVNQDNWGSEPILIDNFNVSNASGETLAFEDFDLGFGIFNADSAVTRIAGEKKTEVYTDTTGRNDISKMKMTTDGSYLYALVETVEDIKGFGSANCMSLFMSDRNVGGCWNQYEYVVNRDSSKATSTELIVETFKAGEWVETGRAKYRIEGNVMHMAIPLSALGNTDTFEMEFKWADNYSEDDIYSFYLNGDAAPYGRANYVYSSVGSEVGITIDKMSSERGKVSFITKQAYPEGSTVSFDILIPENKNDKWWGIGFASSPSEAYIYEWNDKKSSLYGSTLTAPVGVRTNCTIKIPEGNGDQYIYFIGAVGEWPSDTNEDGAVVYLDNFVIDDGNKIVREGFNGGYGIFNVDENSVALVTNKETLQDCAAEIHISNLSDSKGGFNFITADSYPAGTEIVFDAYIPSGSLASDWCGAVAITNPNQKDVYVSAGEQLSMVTTDTWVTYKRTATEDDSYFVIGGNLGSSNWVDRNLFVDNFKIYNVNGDLIAKDDFSQGLHAGLFNVTEMNGAKVAVSLGAPGDAGSETNTTYADGAMSIAYGSSTAVRSENIYPQGSIITFDAYVPHGMEWWGIDSITDTNDTSIYDDGSCVYNQNSYYHGGWASYTWTLDSTGYIAFESSENGGALWIDNIIIKNPSGKVLVKENFNNETLEDSMFDVLQADRVKIIDATDDTVDVNFMAYDAPTINGVVRGAAYDKIDAAYKKLAQAGFTKALALREGSTSINDAQAATGSTAFADYVKWRTEQLDPDATTVLDIANKYGLSYYVKDWSFYNLGRKGANLGIIDSTLISAAADFKTVTDTVLNNSSFIEHPAYAGHYATDEPADNTTDFNALKYQATYYNKWMADSGKAGELYVNLVPAYGTQDDRDWWDKLIGNAVNKYNTDYVNSYLQKYLNVATNADSKINYISWDYYPFMVDGHDAKTLREENYLYNFNVMAQAAKANDLELRLTLQSTDEATYGLRDITSVADMKFQIYTGMAFGVNDFTYYKYSGVDGEGIFDYMTGETDETLYGYAKEVNNDVHAIENYFADYKWDSVMAKQGTNTTTMSDRMITGAQLANSDSIVHGNISSVAASQDTLCGIFTAVDTAATTRPYGYMFVNIADPKANATDDVTINFGGNVKAVCVCQDGVQKIVTVSGNTYSFTLTAGAGAFIVPILG